MVDGDPSVKRIIDFARQLEGVARNASTHAAGVVISREPLTELMPLQKATNSDALMTQYEMHGIEALGLLKFDFLGLSNLTILRQAVDLVKRERAIEIDLERSRSTTRRRSSCSRRARRPASSSWSRRACGPTSASSARRRSTTSRRWSRSTARVRWRTSPPHPPQARPGSGHLPPPAARPYLEKTYGIFVYQEDIMSAAVALGGFTGPGRHPRLRDPQEEVVGPAGAEGEVRHPGRGARRRPDRHRPGLRGVPAVRAVRLQQGARDVLRADRLPDRLSQGQLHGRVHDQRAHRVPLERGEGRGSDRRVPPDGHRGPPRTSTARASSSPSRARRSGSGCSP